MVLPIVNAVLCPILESMIKSNTVVLVSFDTTRTDVLFSGKFSFFDNLCKDSILFSNSVVSAPLTPVSHASVFTGLMPEHHGIRHLFKEKLSENVTTIAEKFKAHGYSTSAVVSCPGMNKWYGFNRGFDYYNDELALLPDGTDALNTVDVEKRGSVKRRAKNVVSLGLDALKKNYKKKNFLFLHFFDAHWPYDAPEDFGEGNCYEKEIHYYLKYLQDFMNELSKDSFYDDITYIFFNDHGEDLNGLYLNDRGGEKGHPEEKGHGCLLYNQTVKAFIMFYNKQNLSPQRINDAVHLIDVYPTICELFGFNYTGTDGIPLINNTNEVLPYVERPLFIETFYPEEYKAVFDCTDINVENKLGVILANKFKLIIGQETHKIELYDIENDKNEQINLWRY